MRKQLLTGTIQFVKFGIVGLSNTIICYMVYALCVWFGLHYLVGNAIGFFVSVFNAFYWNNKYVFKNDQESKRVWWKALLRSTVSYSITSLFLTSVFLYLWIDKVGVSPYLGQLLNMCITIPLNFFLNKHWAFK